MNISVADDMVKFSETKQRVHKHRYSLGPLVLHVVCAIRREPASVTRLTVLPALIARWRVGQDGLETFPRTCRTRQLTRRTGMGSLGGT